MKTIDVSEHGAVIRLDGRTLSADVQTACYAAALRGIAIVKGKAREEKVMDTGEYMRAWSAAELPEGAVLYNGRPYAPVIELGRRAGARMPPVAPLAAWVHRKLRPEGGPAAEAAIALAIARKIKARGIPGKLIMINSLGKLADALGEELRRIQVGRGA